jgi:hypothetical protein
MTNENSHEHMVNLDASCHVHCAISTCISHAKTQAACRNTKNESSRGDAQNCLKTEQQVASIAPVHDDKL